MDLYHPGGKCLPLVYEPLPKPSTMDTSFIQFPLNQQVGWSNLVGLATTVPWKEVEWQRLGRSTWSSTWSSGMELWNGFGCESKPTNW